MAELTNVIHQTREHPYGPYEHNLADALEQIIASGTRDLDGIVAALVSANIRGPRGLTWTRDLFVQEMARLGS